MDQTEEIPPGYARVTEILDAYNKFEDIEPAVLQNAADRGRRVHKYCEMYCKDLPLIDIEEDCRGYIKSFCEWADSMIDGRVAFMEQRINSSKYRLSGKFDMICTLKDSPNTVLLDLKTPASKNPTWALQQAAYKILIEEEKKFPIDRRVCLMLSKQGKSAKIVEYTDHANDKRLFLNALEIYRHFNP